MSFNNIVTHEFLFQNIVYTIYEGKNAAGNNYILDLCQGCDIWFHVNESPSAHIVLVCSGVKGNKIPRQVIKRCCCICKASTRTSEKTEIIYTERENLEKLNKVGTVAFVDITKTKVVTL